MSTAKTKEDVKYVVRQMEKMALEKEKQKIDDSDYTLVVAIDFGTAFSGYAFSFKHDPEDVKVNRNWGTSLGLESYKTPTCILLDENGEFVSFGYQAQKDYSELEDGLDQKCYLFDFFKMQLHKETNINATYPLTANNGEKMPAVEVFAKALWYLKDHFMSSLEDSNINVKHLENDIRWVITVPAIWSFKAKGFMRAAAYKGGLIQNRNSKKLVIALEPESGSIFCRNLDINQFADSCRQHEMKLQPGTTYIVLDAGGGTLDVSVLKVVDANKAEEVYCATGGAHGGHFVDIKFEELLYDILSKKFMEDFINSYPSQWLAMKMDFEQKKRACRADSDTSTKLQLLYQLGTAYQEFTGESIESAFKRQKGRGVRISNGMIVLKHNVVEDLFYNVIRGNVTHLRNLLQDMKEEAGVNFKNPEYIFMVGGFSDSHLLQQEIISNFGEGSKYKMRVMIPQEAVLAVVKGAVRFGHNPSLITERKAMCCYGIKVRNDFVMGVHDVTKRKIRDGKAFVHIFDVIVDRNNPMKTFGVGEYEPTHPGQKAVDIELYYVEYYGGDDSDTEETPSQHDKKITKKASNKIRYIDDEDIVQLCTVSAPWEGTGLKRKIKIELELSGTEIILKAETQPGNGKIEKYIDLWHEQDQEAN